MTRIGTCLLELKDLILRIAAFLRLSFCWTRRFWRLLNRCALLVFLAFLLAVPVPFFASSFDHSFNSLHLGHLRYTSILNRIGRYWVSSSTWVNVDQVVPSLDVLLNFDEFGINWLLRLVLHSSRDRQLDLIIITDRILDLVLLDLPCWFHTDWAFVLLTAGNHYGFLLFLDILLNLLDFWWPQISRV